MSGLRLAVLVSGGGTNLQSIIDACEKDELKSQIVCVISNKETAYGLERARRHDIPAIYLDGKSEHYDACLLETLKANEIDLVVLAGYLKILSPELIATYHHRIINIHPSLLPKFGGKGFYGIHVHEAVLAAGEKESGATVHYVDEGVDTGEIILQRKLAILPEDTPSSLQTRILEQIEHKILVAAIKLLEGEES